MLRIAHISDQHWEYDKLDRCKQSHKSIIDSMKRLGFDLIIDTGDFWNRKQTLNKASAFLDGIQALNTFSTIAPMIMIKGNNEHDNEGSIEWLYQLNTHHPIHFSERADSVLFIEQSDGRRYFVPFKHFDPAADAKILCLLHLFPYPTKAHFLADVGNVSIDEGNNAIREGIRQLFTGFGSISQQVQCPVIFLGHCNVRGAKLSNGQILLGQDILIGKHDIELSRANYYALGHLHNAQNITPNMQYAGSSYHCNWGETEEKSFNAVEFDTEDPVNVPNCRRIPIASRPLSIHECEYSNGLLFDSGPRDISPDWLNAHLRVRFNCTKEQSGLITDDEIRAYYAGAYDYQIERIIIPEERVRASEIVLAKNLADKVKGWAKVIEKDLPEEIFALVDEIERSAEI